ncbi:MAG: type I-B CRISPR-associated protein Cas7/Cst2/DevR, partial [Thermoplasmataceae archaeon]
MKIKCMTITSLIKIDAGNANSGYNEDIISTIKKIRYPNGDAYPYISGQAIRRMLRERLKDSGFEMSPKDVVDTGKDKSPFSTSCNPEKYVDDDLFGFMNAKERLTRTSAVRVSPAVALFPYKHDRDLGIQNNNDIGKDHRMYETEVTSNWFAYSALIETDRIGNGLYEMKEGKEFRAWAIENGEKLRRLKGLVESFLYLWGGGKQSRIMTSESPVAIAISLQTVKNPIWMGKLRVDESGNLNDSVLLRIIEENKDI